MNKYILLSGLILFSSCSEHSYKWKDAMGREPNSVSEFISYIPKLNSRIRDPQSFNNETCVPFIKKYTTYLWDKPSDFYFPKDEAEKAIFTEKGEESLQGLFSLKMGLREFVQANDESLSRECIDEVRNAIRYTRFAEDSLAEWIYNHTLENKELPKLHFEGGAPHTLLNPKFSGVEYKAGDLLLMRGQSFISATIARIGDVDAQFSHLGIIGQDKEGKLYVVESLIETGIIYTPLDEFRKKEEARLVLLRLPDQELATKAARKIFDFAFEQKSKGDIIPYDFAMLDDDHSEFFCSEVIRYAYKLGSNNEFLVPKYRTSFSKLYGSSFLKEMGVKAKITFAPVDIEIDPRFDVVAEYRTVTSLRKIRMQDSVLTSIYRWIEEEGYEFKFTIDTKFKSKLAVFIRSLGFAKSKMQKSMPSSTLETVMKLQTLTEPIEKNIFKIEEEYFKEHGHSLTFKDLLKVNEEYRVRDCEAYQKNRQASYEGSYDREKVDFHLSFRGPNSKQCSRN